MAVLHLSVDHGLKLGKLNSQYTLKLQWTAAQLHVELSEKKWHWAQPNSIFRNTNIQLQMLKEEAALKTDKVWNVYYSGGRQICKNFLF